MEEYKSLYLSIEDKLPVFYKSWWLDAVCSGSWQVAIVQEEGTITAVWPYQLEHKWGLSLVRNPLLTPYLGPFLLPQKKECSTIKRLDWEEEQLKKLIAQLPKTAYLQFTTVPGFQNFLPLLQEGIKNTNRITYEIDLQLSEEALLDNIQKRRRRYIRNADERLRIVDGHSIQEDFFKIHQKTFDKKNTKYPYSIPFFKKLMLAAETNKAAKFWALVDDQGALAAGLWVVYDNKSMYQLLSSFPQSNLYPNAMSLLTWHAICEAKKAGLLSYDFEGSIDTGIELFFRKFGGKRNYYLYFEQHSSILWRTKKILLG